MNSTAHKYNESQTNSDTRPSCMPMVVIQPRDESLPCPFADLPSELRCLIYHFAYCDEPVENESLFWPGLLRTSRAIRIELAQVFYSSAPFKFTIHELNFSGIIGLVERLPPQHKAHLAKNQHLKLTLRLRRIAQAGGPFIISVDPNLCELFGNLADVPFFIERRHFQHFCTFAEWWLWCGQPEHRNIQWHYDLSFDPEYVGAPNLLRRDLLHFVENFLCAVMKRSVQQNWIRTRQEGMMKKEALNMLVEMDKIRKRPTTQYLGEFDPEMNTEMDKREWNMDFNSQVNSAREFFGNW